MMSPEQLAEWHEFHRRIRQPSGDASQMAAKRAVAVVVSRLTQEEVRELRSEIASWVQAAFEAGHAAAEGRRVP